MRQIYFGFVLFVASSLTAAAQQSALDCAASAAMNYNTALLALHEQTGINLSVKAEIAKRRLEEQYCLVRAKCETQSYATEQWYQMVLATSFNECLHDEAEEKLKHPSPRQKTKRKK